MYDPTQDASHLTRIMFCGPTKEDADELWHEYRRFHVGASDAGIILSKSPFTSPYEIWMQKTQRTQPYPETPHLYWGRVMEPIVIAEYQQRNPDCRVCNPLDAWKKLIAAGAARDLIRLKKLEIRQPEGQDLWNTVKVDEARRMVFQNHNFKLASASPDALVQHKETGEVWGLEVKNSGSWGGWDTPRDDGSFDPMTSIPPTYYLQCVWSMMVLDLDRWDLAVLIAGNDYRQYKFRRDRQIEAKVLGEIEHWWEAHIEGDVEPPMSGHKTLDGILLAKYKDSNDTFLPTSQKLEAIILSLNNDMDELDEIENRISTNKQQLKAHIGSNRGIRGRTHRVEWIRYKAKQTKWKEVALALARQLNPTGEIDSEILNAYSSEQDRDKFVVNKIDRE